MSDDGVRIMSAAEFKTRREATGATQSWVARRLGHTPGTVKRWESGRCPVPLVAVTLIEDTEEWAAGALADLRATLDPPGLEPPDDTVITLERYRDDATFRAAFGPSKYSASIHAMWLARAREALVRDGYRVRIEYATR
jgi:transcriptional regulator with XRE-family HTH domain